MQDAGRISGVLREMKMTGVARGSGSREGPKKGQKQDKSQKLATKSHN